MGCNVSMFFFNISLIYKSLTPVLSLVPHPLRLKEEQHQEDLKVLRLRLEALNNVQNQQLAQLADLAPEPRPTSTFDPSKLERGDLHSPELTPREKQDPEKGPGGDGAEGAVMSLADLS